MPKKRGRKPKDATTKSLEGNPGRRPLTQAQQATALAQIPTPPAWLGTQAKKVWKETSVQLAKLGLLLELDLLAFAQYCQAWQDYFDAVADCKKNGETYMTEKGSECERPAVWKKNRAIKTIECMGARFGLTPDSRRGLNIETKQETDPTNPLEAELGDKN